MNKLCTKEKLTQVGVTFKRAMKATHSRTLERSTHRPHTPSNNVQKGTIASTWPLTTLTATRRRVEGVGEP